jgi:hypothetical protein
MRKRREAQFLKSRLRPRARHASAERTPRDELHKGKNGPKCLPVLKTAYFAERIASAIFAASTVAFTSCVRMMCAPFRMRATSLARVP